LQAENATQGNTNFSIQRKSITVSKSTYHGMRDKLAMYVSGVPYGQRGVPIHLDVQYPNCISHFAIAIRSAKCRHTCIITAGMSQSNE
jgi:hypothetical protein